MDLFEQLRREHEFGIGTIAGVAAKFGVHRRVVRKAIASALPRPHRYPPRAKPKLGPVAAFIDEVLDADRHAPRKQRHTARRLYRRILTEFPEAAVAESTVRNHVRERKRQMGLVRRETFVPQSYSWAQEAQVDWYEAWVDLGDERTKIQVFAMRSMASGAAFHRAYLHATQQAFLEAHEHAFAYFGGVFHLSGMFRAAFAKRRCLVPASAYYEWRDDPDGKVPFAVARVDGDPVAFGGIWEEWRSPDGETLRTFATITTDANRQLSAIQDRMPVIIEPEDWPLWLGEVEGDPTIFLRAKGEDVLRVWPVDKKVGNVRNDGPDLLEPRALAEPTLL